MANSSLDFLFSSRLRRLADISLGYLKDFAISSYPEPHYRYSHSQISTPSTLPKYLCCLTISLSLTPYIICISMLYWLHFVNISQLCFFISFPITTFLNPRYHQLPLSIAIASCWSPSIYSCYSPILPTHSPHCSQMDFQKANLILSLISLNLAMASHCSQ